MKLFEELLDLFGAKVSTKDLYPALFRKSVEGNADCGGILVYNYMAGEGVTHLDAGRPMVVRKPESDFSLADFMRSQLYSTMATLKIGMDILAEEQVRIDKLLGHGGLFKTPGVAQRYMAAACNVNVTCMETAGEGGPFGMALLASYLVLKEQGELLEQFLENKVFQSAVSSTLAPNPSDVAGFEQYVRLYRNGLGVEKAAAELI